jgi:phage/plasmid-like protein (TIGR03299 family)
MAHEIHQHDNVVLHREKAWHGLGIVVESAPSPQEALRIAGLDWTVEQWPLSATNGDTRVIVSDHVLNIRTDTRTQLGVVGKGYQPIQNRELAEFSASLSELDGVKVETAGSIRNGQKVWFLLRGESFAVKDRDVMKSYILVSNGHDGGTALRCTPTTVRVVCSNTLHLVIPRFEAEGNFKQASPACYAARHTGSVKDKVEEARAALRLYANAVEQNKRLIDQLATKEMNHEAVQRFLLECYTRDFDTIPDQPTNAQQHRQRGNAVDAIRAMLTRFEKEEAAIGASAWSALNAYTGWIQHDRRIRRVDPAAREELRLHSRLFGVDADRTTAAYATALTI